MILIHPLLKVFLIFFIIRNVINHNSQYCIYILLSKIILKDAFSKRTDFLISVDVRRPEASQPDVPVLRPADDDSAAHQEAVLAESRHEGEQTFIDGGSTCQKPTSQVNCLGG